MSLKKSQEPAQVQKQRQRHVFRVGSPGFMFLPLTGSQPEPVCPSVNRPVLLSFQVDLQQMDVSCDPEQAYSEGCCELSSVVS